MKSLLLAVALVGLVSAAPEGKLVFHKVVDSEFPGLFGEDKNFTVSLSVHNIGEGSAFDVSIADDWPSDLFEVLSGDLTTTWAEIGAGKSESVELLVQPVFEGPFTPQRASLNYLATADSEEAQNAFSTGNAPMRITSATFYEKVTAKHHQEWAIFTISSLATVLVPLFVYSFIQINYTNGVPNSLGNKSD